jgi:quercetin dioxygenase-like cupin family protein
MPVYKEKDIAPERVSPTQERRIVYLDNIMVVVCDFTNGPALHPDPPHSHPHEQITYIAEGDLYFFLDGKKLKLAKGDMLSVPPDAPHCIQTISNHVRLIDSFSPIRKDFLKQD